MKCRKIRSGETILEVMVIDTKIKKEKYNNDEQISKNEEKSGQEIKYYFAFLLQVDVRLHLMAG